MSIQDQLVKMLKGGVSEIFIGLTPEAVPYVQVKQFVATSAVDGNNMVITHQRTGNDIGALLSGIADDLNHCAKLQTKLALVPKEAKS